MDKFKGVPYGLFLGPKVSEWFSSVCPRLACDRPAAGTGQAVASTHMHPSHSADARVAVSSCLQELEEVGGLDELEKELARIRSRGM